MRSFSKRDKKEFNLFRACFQQIVSRWTFGLYLSMKYKMIFDGDLSKLKGKRFIVAANHVTGNDPFILVRFFRGFPLAFMAKKELFEKFFCRLLMDWCGAFSVNREKLEVSTIKTAISIKDTKWTLALFPQGTRIQTDVIENVNKGFVSIAKSTKSDILPVALKKLPTGKTGWQSEKIIIKVGEIIPYSNNIDDMMNKWIEAINSLLNSIES